MVPRIVSLILALALAVGAPQVCFAQSAQDKSGDKPNGTRKQLTLIVFAGISGAILGLSTLSFYGRPQDKLNNIWGGFAVGIIVGAIYSAYSVASQPREFSRGAENNDGPPWLPPPQNSRGSQIWDDEDWRRDHPRFATSGDPFQFSYAIHF